MLPKQRKRGVVLVRVFKISFALSLLGCASAQKPSGPQCQIAPMLGSPAFRLDCTDGDLEYSLPWDRVEDWFCYASVDLKKLIQRSCR